MNLPSNPFLKAIRAGEPQIGLWLSLASNVAAEVVASAGFDWVMVDMEHAPNDLNSVLTQLQVYAGYDTTALVRPDWNDFVKTKRLLDSGAQGLLFPMVQSADEAAAAVAGCRYPPRGNRGVAGINRGNRFGRIGDYFQRVEDETAILLQCETRQAIEQVEAIAAVDGVDGVFFGPSDIAADIGRLGQPMHRDVWDLVLPAAAKLRADGVATGTLVTNADDARRMLNEGFTFVACSTDVSLLARGADALVKAVRDR